MPLWRAVLIWLLLAAACVSAFGQQYPFLAVPGSPKNVKVLFQDARGRLWMAGDRLACYDGARVFFLDDYGLPKTSTYSIDEDSSGAVWIGAETGIYRFSNGRVEEISKGVVVSVAAITPDLIVAAAGPLGQGVPLHSSLVRMERRAGVWKTETVMDMAAPGPFTLDHKGSLLYVDPTRGWTELQVADIAQWRPGMHLRAPHHALPGVGPAAGPLRVLRDRSGCVWFGSTDENMYDCGDQKWTPAPFPGADVRTEFSETPDGKMLLVGYNMLALGRPGKFQLATLANGLPQTNTAIQSRDGTIWVGGSQGLFRFASPFQMEFWTARDGVTAPWCIQRSGARIYAGLNRDVGVLSLNRQRWQSIASFKEMGLVQSLLAAGNGNILAALNAGGAALLRTDGTVLARTAPSATFYGLHLTTGQDQSIWLGGISLGQLTRFGAKLHFEDHYLPTRPAGNVLDVQYETTARKLWACYTGGLTERSADGRWREWGVKDGLLVNPCWSLAALANGDVWYGYYNTPAFARLRPTAAGGYSVRQFRSGDGIEDAESLTFDVDRRGWLWRGGNKGLSVATAADADSGKWLFLDQSDGLSSEGINNGSYFEDTDGSLWFGSDISIFHYSPKPDLLTPKVTPAVFLSSFSSKGEGPTMAEAVGELPHGVKAIAHLGSLQFEGRHGLRVRYRVLPEQSKWRETVSLDLPLDSLGSGGHTLEAQGRLFGGPWSATVTRTFRVATPAWRRWPWLVLYAVVASLLFVSGFFLHRRNQWERATVLPDLGAWRLGALLPEVDELTGTLLDGRFDVGDLLARGGFAHVLNGYDRQQNRRCAVKVFRREMKNQSWIERRFAQEVAALQKVHHPNVVSIYAHGFTAAGAPYLVMEFVDGQVLRELLEQGPLKRARTAHLLRQLAAALDGIHALEICHRDLKPENIIIRDPGTRDEQAILIDFSIAIVKDANEALYGLSRAAGSFDYMPPEQVIGYADPASDIYSLAKLTIEMLTGKRLSELLPAASLDLPARMRELLAELQLGLSEESVAALSSALEFDPAKRPHVAGDFSRPLVRDLSQPPERAAEALA